MKEWLDILPVAGIQYGEEAPPKGWATLSDLQKVWGLSRSAVRERLGRLLDRGLCERKLVLLKSVNGCKNTAIFRITSLTKGKKKGKKD